MVAAAASALSGRVFPLPGGTMPPARSSRWRIVEWRAFEEAGGIVGVRPCGRGEDKGDKASAGEQTRQHAPAAFTVQQWLHDKQKGRPARRLPEN
jgi:hypothetical protein